LRDEKEADDRTSAVRKGGRDPGADTARDAHSMIGRKGAFRPEDPFFDQLKEDEKNSEEPDGDVQLTRRKPSNQAHTKNHPQDDARNEVAQIAPIPFSPVVVKRKGVA